MWFVVVGVLLVVAKILDVWPVIYWSWWAVLAPFVLAIVWWAVLDASGSTRREAMRQMDAKKDERRRKAMKSLGLDERDKRRKS
jgi:small Trp-rich protein